MALSWHNAEQALQNERDRAQVDGDNRKARYLDQCRALLASRREAGSAGETLAEAVAALLIARTECAAAFENGVLILDELERNER